HDRAVDPFPGSCPFHGDCLEGLASGPALEARWGVPAAELERDEAWQLEARYLALGLLAAVSLLSPERIVLGGGVARRRGLHGLVLGDLRELMNGYPGVDLGDDYVTPPALGSRAGVLGAIALAQDAASYSAGRGKVG